MPDAPPGRRVDMSRAAASTACSVALLLGIAGAAGPALAAGDDPAPRVLLGEVITQSRVFYPLRAGSWQAIGEQRYAPQALGVSIRYVDNRKRHWLDLYVYPAGLLGDAGLEQAAMQERTQIGEAAQQTGRAVVLGELAALGADSPVRGWQLDLHYPDERTRSAMVLFARDLYLVKVRASVTDAELPPETMLALVRDVVARIAPYLHVIHTGDCWMGARVQIVDGLHDDPQVLASTRDAVGRLQAQLFTDRVLVDAAAQAEAPALASALNQSVYPGCVAPDAIDLNVPDGLREIRIEYPSLEASPGNRAKPRRRPRPPLSGIG